MSSMRIATETSTTRFVADASAGGEDAAATAKVDAGRHILTTLNRLYLSWSWNGAYYGTDGDMYRKNAGLLFTVIKDLGEKKRASVYYECLNGLTPKRAGELLQNIKVMSDAYYEIRNYPVHQEIVSSAQARLREKSQVFWDSAIPVINAVQEKLRASGLAFEIPPIERLRGQDLLSRV